MNEYELDYREEYYSERFRGPGGKSALHPGKRLYPCPTCQRPDQLTAKDQKSGYQCDRCANACEGDLSGEY